MEWLVSVGVYILYVHSFEHTQPIEVTHPLLAFAASLFFSLTNP